MSDLPSPDTPTLVVGGRPHEGNRLACPGCGETTGTHLDAVRVAAREEGGPVTHVAVDTVTGRTTTPGDEPTPQGRVVGEGERHRVAVGGQCRLCSARFALVLTQHQGITFVEWALT